MGYIGEEKRVVSSNYLFNMLQDLYTKIKGLLTNKADKNHTHSEYQNNIRIHDKIDLKSGTFISCIIEQINNGYRGGKIEINNYCPSDTCNGNYWGMVEWICNENQFIHMFFYTDRWEVIYVREYSVGESTDTGWQRLGDGCNADTVDGYHADSFAKTSGAYFTGNITIHSAEMNGKYNGLLVGDDCYIGDCNIGNTLGLMGTSNNDIAYIKFGKSGGTLGFDGSNMVFQNNVTVPTIYSDNWFRSTGSSGWFNETYGGGLWMCDNSWIRVYAGKGFEVENSVQVLRNGLNNPTWGDFNSCIEVKTSDGTRPSICLHRSGYTHVTLGNSVSGELDIGFDGDKWAQAYHTRNITKGTWELTSGVSSLATNNIYIQYE